MSVAAPLVTVPPWAALMSTEPVGGGPRPLPGVDAGSVGVCSTLVSVAAPSEAGGVIAPEVVELIGVVAPCEVPPATPPVLAAARLIGEVDPGTTVGVEPVLTGSIVVVAAAGVGVATSTVIAGVAGAELTTVELVAAGTTAVVVVVEVVVVELTVAAAGVATVSAGTVSDTGTVETVEVWIGLFEADDEESIGLVEA